MYSYCSVYMSAYSYFPRWCPVLSILFELRKNSIGLSQHSATSLLDDSPPPPIPKNCAKADQLAKRPRAEALISHCPAWGPWEAESMARVREPKRVLPPLAPLDARWFVHVRVTCEGADNHPTIGTTEGTLRWCP